MAVHSTGTDFARFIDWSLSVRTGHRWPHVCAYYGADDVTQVELVAGGDNGLKGDKMVSVTVPARGIVVLPSN